MSLFSPLFSTIRTSWKATLLLLFMFSTVHAQTPDGLPKPQDNTPIDFSSRTDLIVYVLIPIALLLLYFFLKRRKQRRSK